jgi:uncharacterized protein (DUF2249 family)
MNPADNGTAPVGRRRRDLDVRPMLADGREPFSTIMDTVEGLDHDEDLALRTPFDPVPLHRALAGRGFRHDTRELGPGDFETIYRRADGDERADVASPHEQPAHADRDGAHVVLDVRGMTPPQPMELTLAAIETLERGQRLLQINDRVPVFLLPLLDERGFRYAIEEDPRGTLVVIWREAGDAAP